MTILFVTLSFNTSYTNITNITISSVQLSDRLLYGFTTIGNTFTTLILDKKRMKDKGYINHCINKCRDSFF